MSGPTGLPDQPGWGFFDDLKKQADVRDLKYDDQRRRVAEAMLAAFTTEAGAVALDILEKEVLDRSSMPDVGAEMMLLDPRAFTIYVAWNEAQKALVRKVKKLMDEAKSPSKPGV